MRIWFLGYWCIGIVHEGSLEITESLKTPIESLKTPIESLKTPTESL